MESFWDHFGIILESFWDNLGIILGSFWNHYSIILESFWDDFGIILGPFWNQFGIIIFEFFHWGNQVLIIGGTRLVRLGEPPPPGNTIRFSILIVRTPKASLVGRTELSLRLSCTEFCALSSGHGPRRRGFEGGGETLDFHDFFTGGKNGKKRENAR